MRKLPLLTERPQELLGHDYDVKWSRKGQKLAAKMASYVFEAMMIEPAKRPQVPRVLVYKTIEPKGAAGPLAASDAAYFYYPNYIAMCVPDESRGRRTFCEYQFLARSPIIGDFYGTPREGFNLDLAHEMAHWVVEVVLGDKRAQAHGRKFRVAYALLREKFVNRPNKRRG